MFFPKFSVLALLSLRALCASAKTDQNTAEEKLDVPPPPTKLAVSVDINFPDAEIFGVKLVNGRPTRSVLEFTNHEEVPVQVSVIGGVLTTLKLLPPGSHPSAAIVRNLTGTKYDVEIPAGAQKSVPYSFTTDMNPEDLRLQIVAVILNQEGMMYQIQAFNETVSVVEAPISIFDPQIIFLYLFLLGAFVGTIYMVYVTWIKNLFPHTRRGGKGGAKRSGGSKKASSQEQGDGADGAAVTTQSESQKPYDESWIPEHHINRPTAKRVKSGASSKSKSRGTTE